MSEYYGQRDWFSRLAAILFAWTLGLIIGAFVIIVGSFYSVLGTLLRWLGVGSHSDIPFWKPVKSTFKWWFSIHSHAISGTGTWTLTPPVLD